MTFQTIPFILFLCFDIVILALTKNEKIRQYELLAMSFVFYGSWDLRFLALIVLVIAITHIVGRQLLINSKNGKGHQTKRILIFGITALLVILGIFKYLKFFVNSFCDFLGIQNAMTLSIILPVGISFYVFSAIGYIMDVYRKEITEPVPLYKETLYITFFPKMLQGPFQKANHFFEQLAGDHTITIAHISEGMQIFLFGLIKKIVIADRLGSFVDIVYADPSVYSGGTLLLAAITYPIQLYCDFSGYSDMAVGTAKMLGYDLPQNFNLPFLSKTVSEYWRRWHMSLNAWFRDYLFYSILWSSWVNRLRKKVKGKSKKIAKILPSVIGVAIVWPLMGLWHGASINYILFGCIYGLFMMIGLIGDVFGGEKNKKFDFLRIIRTGLITLFAMILFRASDMVTAGLMLRGIFSFQKGVSYIYTWSLIYIPTVMGLSIFAYKKNGGNGFYLNLDLGLLRNKIIFCTAVLLTIVLMYVGKNYFMYFQF